MRFVPTLLPGLWFQNTSASRHGAFGCRNSVAAGNRLLLRSRPRNRRLTPTSNGLTCCRRKLEGIFPTKLQSLESVNDWFQNLNQKQSAINFLLQIPNRQTEGKTGKTKRFTGDCRWLPVIAGDCRWLPVIGYIMLHHVSSCCIPAHGHHGPSWPIMAHHGPSWLIGAGLQFHLLQRWQIQELHPGGWQRAAEVQLDILRVQWSHLAQEKFIWNRSFVHPISVIWRGLLVFFLQNQGHQYILEVDSNASSIWPIRLQKKCLNPKGYMTPHANRRWKG